jgi:hypothetical protein
LTSSSLSPVRARGVPGAATAGAVTLLSIASLLVIGGCGDAGAEPGFSEPVAAERLAAGPLPAVSPTGGFSDVTLAAGITAEHRLPGPELENIVDAVGAGAAFADLDDDGLLDLIVLGGPRSPQEEGRQASRNAGIRLYRNRGDGRFEDVTRRSRIPADSSAAAVAVGDVDGDGDRDVYLVDRGPNRLYLNRGDATFEDVTRRAGVDDPAFGVGAVFFDADRDGDQDLYVTNYLEFDPRVQEYFAPEGFPGPLAYKAQADVFYRNRGDGTYDDASRDSGVAALAARGMSLAAADLDEDGDTDLFVANDATANFLLAGDGRGGFEEVGMLAGVAMGENGEETSAMASAVGDVDGDGFLDLAVSDTAFGALYRRTAPGFYTDDVMRSGIGRLSGQYVSWGQNLLDYDNDGLLDLFLVNGGMHHLVGWEDLLLRNVGGGRFEDVSGSGGPYFTTRQVGRSSISGDYDNDGDEDLFVTTLGGRHFLLRNDAPPRAAWITLDLVGRDSRDPFGARVELLAAGRVRVAEARCPTAYLGQSDPRLHFGLGEDVETVERIRIVWPDGTEQVLHDPPLRTVLRVTEPGASR